jgi:hypothetical protein
MSNRRSLSARRGDRPGDVVDANDNCHDYYDDSSSSSSHSSSDWKRGRTHHKKPHHESHKCGPKCHVPCEQIKCKVESALCHDDLNKGYEHCKDVETCVDHCYTVKVGKHNVKKHITYNHVIVADVTHHVKEQVNCVHKYHKDVVHKETCKVVDGNDCKETYKPPHKPCKPCKPHKPHKPCKSDYEYYDESQSSYKKCNKKKCGKCGKSKKNKSHDSSSCSSSFPHSKY